MRIVFGGKDGRTLLITARGTMCSVRRRTSDSGHQVRLGRQPCDVGSAEPREFRRPDILFPSFDVASRDAWIAPGLPTLKCRSSLIPS